MPDAGATLLVAEDNDELRDVMRRRLERAGYRVVLARHGGEALQLLAADRFDLAVLDILMPQATGLDVLRSIRTRPETARLPVIMTTALGEMADIERAIKLGASDYLVKPIEFPILLAKIAGHLGAPAPAAGAEEPA